MKQRCGWCVSSELMKEYHDKEWGVPVHDDQLLFELLILEGAQAGLSWSTVLKKRENYRKAFDNFSIARIASYDEIKIMNLLNDEGIIRNRLKVNSVVTNAMAFLEIQKKFGSFDKFIWDFAENKPIVNQWEKLNDIPAKTELSDKISKDLKKQGFKFVGSTIIYAYLQAIGIVNDHVSSCFRGKEIRDAYS